MGFSGSKIVKCIHFDFEYSKCLHKDKQTWFSKFLKPDCVEIQGQRCPLKEYEDVKFSK